MASTVNVLHVQFSFFFLFSLNSLFGFGSLYDHFLCFYLYVYFVVFCFVLFCFCLFVFFVVVVFVVFCLFVFCCFFMPRHQKVAGYYVIPSEILSVRPSVRLSVCPSVRPSVCPSVSAHHHSCIGNSSYSFRPILLKLYRCFKDGLKICILFFQNPEIIFYHFFRIFNLDIFRALILQICIWSMYLVSATPPTVFGESF